jgi:hypothetical protein
MSLLSWFQTEPKAYHWKTRENPPKKDGELLWGIDDKGNMATVLYRKGEWFIRMEPGILARWGELQKWRYKVEGEK